MVVSRGCKNNFQNVVLKQKREDWNKSDARRNTDELVFAVKTDLYQRGKRAGADPLSQSTEYSPSRPVKLRHILNKKLKRSGFYTIHPRRCFDFYFEYGNV